MSLWRHNTNLVNASRQLMRSYALKHQKKPDDPSFLPVITKLIDTGNPTDEIGEKYIAHQLVIESACKGIFPEPPKILTLGGMADADKYLQLYYTNVMGTHALFNRVNSFIDFDGRMTQCRVTDLFKELNVDNTKFFDWVYKYYQTHRAIGSDGNIGTKTIQLPKKITFVMDNGNYSNYEFDTTPYENNDVVFDLELYGAKNQLPLLHHLVNFHYGTLFSRYHS